MRRAAASRCASSAEAVVAVNLRKASFWARGSSCVATIVSGCGTVAGSVAPIASAHAPSAPATSTQCKKEEARITLLDQAERFGGFVGGRHDALDSARLAGFIGALIDLSVRKIEQTRAAC